MASGLMRSYMSHDRNSHAGQGATAPRWIAAYASLPLGGAHAHSHTLHVPAAHEGLIKPSRASNVVPQGQSPAVCLPQASSDPFKEAVLGALYLMLWALQVARCARANSPWRFRFRRGAARGLPFTLAAR
jgi:hypothetical protein